MTPNQFRQLALSYPDAIESTHMGHPDFRVQGRIFATLGAPDAGWAMVKLTPDQQSIFVRTQADIFLPCPGAWGRQGCTYVHLKKVQLGDARSAVELAYQNSVQAGPSRSKKSPARPRKPRPKKKGPT